MEKNEQQLLYELVLKRPSPALRSWGGRRINGDRDR